MMLAHQTPVRCLYCIIAGIRRHAKRGVSIAHASCISVARRRPLEALLSANHRLNLRKFNATDIKLLANRPYQRSLFSLQTVFRKNDFEQQADECRAGNGTAGADSPDFTHARA